MIAAVDLTNLLYLIGAIVAATVVSGVVLLRRRRPRSLEASIDMFSRELKALQPERRAATMADRNRPDGRAPGSPGRAVPPLADQEDQPG